MNKYLQQHYNENNNKWNLSCCLIKFMGNKK